MKISCLLATAAVLFPTLLTAGDADWPQWRGPNRDGHAAPQSLLSEWPSEGPQLKWSAMDLGTGYSAVSVVGDQVFTMGSVDGQAIVFCLSLSDGSQIWQTSIGRAGGDNDYNTGWGNGQRCTPTVDGDQVFALSDIGTVAALDRETGEVQWKTELVADHGGEIPTWGYSESPLVDQDRIIVTPGNANFMIGLDRKTGSKVWGSKGVNAPAQYVSVVKGAVGSTAYYATASKPGLFAFDAASGDKLFADEMTGNKVAVIPTPVIEGNFLYHTSDYGAGNTLLELTGSSGAIVAESIYALNTKTMGNHHGGVVLVNGVIYGFTKQSGGNWMAQDFKSGETLWMERSRPNRSGSICYADGRLYCYSDKDGTVTLVTPDRSGWVTNGTLTLPSQTEIPRKSGAIWTHPVVANGTLIVRDQDLMFAYDIAK
ncbi:PQQ-binding-like beta-propeller repeat protein [Roseiconus nitratireducens]|uniref:PQQ-binding-like beta-propeller repeat protein n=1 Tax=Roseiconus nitratireducens TaxID=2605748 RepID=A0A5M6DD31_9BACT|nr:PQQ-binding-like beta-propeller repeat protein [Roseiconus nitratireducens]KAA5544376.1 PQQ-binding-like beta-propeller repeat protein [Roseiconus nitratireducens]